MLQELPDVKSVTVMPVFSYGQVAQIHGNNDSLFFGAIKATNGLVEVYAPDAWSAQKLKVFGELRTVRLSSNILAVGCGLHAPKAGSHHRRCMECFMAAHNTLESANSGVTWPFPSAKPAFSASNRAALMQVRAIMFAAWLFKDKVGIRYPLSGLHAMWKTDKKPEPRVFAAIKAGGEAWSIADANNVTVEPKPWVDWCTCDNATYTELNKQDFSSAFKPKFQRMNQLIYFKEYGKMNGMNLQIESLTSANGTQAGIMAAMEGRAASQNYTTPPGHWTFMRHSMPPLCRLLGKMLWKTTHDALVDLNINGFDVIGADLPMFYLYLQSTDGKLAGCFPDLLIRSGNKLVSVEYKTRWLQKLLDFDSMLPSTIEAYMKMVGNRTTVGTNHTQALAQSYMASMFFNKPTHTILAIAVVPGAEFIEHLGIYHTTVAPDPKREHVYQASVLYQRWKMHNPTTAYADDVVWIESKSPAMLFAVQSQFSEQVLWFKPLVGKTWKVALAGPHRTTTITQLGRGARIPNGKRWRTFKENKDGWWWNNPNTPHTKAAFVDSVAPNSRYKDKLKSACSATSMAKMRLKFLVCSKQ